MYTQYLFPHLFYVSIPSSVVTPASGQHSGLPLLRTASHRPGDCSDEFRLSTAGRFAKARSLPRTILELATNLRENGYPKKETMDYPLAICFITMENHHVYWENSRTFNGHLSQLNGWPPSAAAVEDSAASPSEHRSGSEKKKVVFFIIQCAAPQVCISCFL